MNAESTTGTPSLVSSLAGSPMPALTSRLDFARLLDQRHRLMQVQTALPALSLIPERMVFREAVGQPFELRLQCLSTSAHLELKTLLGEQLQHLRDGGSPLSPQIARTLIRRQRPQTLHELASAQLDQPFERLQLGQRVGGAHGRE